MVIKGIGQLDESEKGDDGSGSSGGQFPSFTMPNNMTNFLWDLGTYFINNEAFKDAIIVRISALNKRG